MQNQMADLYYLDTRPANTDTHARKALGLTPSQPEAASEVDNHIKS